MRDTSSLNSEGDAVFVEVSPEICRYDEPLLSTLCHEISHKYFHVNGIRGGFTTIEQEYLTDVTAVYLGMGKLMLNGCKGHYYQTGRSGESQTLTLKTGYISRDCFAFVYRLVCAMRGLDKLPPAEKEEKLLGGLLGEAREAVWRCERTHGDWFRVDFHEPEGVEELYGNLDRLIMHQQDECSRFEQAVRGIKTQVQHLAETLRRPHAHLHLAQQTLKKLRVTEVNPHLSFLRCIETREKVKTLVRESMQGNAARCPDLADLHFLLRTLGNCADSDESEIVTCPIDGTKLRVPRNKKRLRVKCASCGYNFIVNGAPVEHEPKHNGRNPRFPLFRRWFGA